MEPLALGANSDTENINMLRKYLNEWITEYGQENLEFEAQG